MFQVLRNAWKITDLRKKILYTLFIILIFRIGSAITIPFIDAAAIANAVNNQELDRKELYVAEVYANPGPTLKRYVARSRGSASPMLKRTSHISVVLDQKKA